METRLGVAIADLEAVARTKGGLFTLQDALYGVQVINFSQEVINRFKGGEGLAAYSAIFRMRDEKPGHYQDRFLRADLVFSRLAAINAGITSETAVTDLEKMVNLGLSRHGMSHFPKKTGSFVQRFANLPESDRSNLADELRYREQVYNIHDPNAGYPDLNCNLIIKFLFPRLPKQNLNTQLSLFSR